MIHLLPIMTNKNHLSFIAQPKSLKKIIKEFKVKK